MPRWYLFLVLAGLSAAGCDRDGPKLAPVEGRATFQGKPLAEMPFVFQPDHEAGNNTGVLAQGTTAEDGSFEVRTHLGRKGSQPGVAPGRYRLFFRPYPGAPALLPPRYTTFDATPLRYHVRAEGLTSLDVVLEEP